MRIKKLGDDLYLVKPTWWKWSVTGDLSKALLEIQGSGKVVTSIVHTLKLPDRFLVCTEDKKVG